MLENTQHGMKSSNSLYLSYLSPLLKAKPQDIFAKILGKTNKTTCWKVRNSSAFLLSAANWQSIVESWRVSEDDLKVACPGGTVRLTAPDKVLWQSFDQRNGHITAKVPSSSTLPPVNF